MESTVDRLHLFEGRNGLHQLSRIDSVWAEPRPFEEAIRRSLELSVAALGDAALLLRHAPPRPFEVLGLHDADPKGVPALGRFASEPDRWPSGLLAAVRNGRPAHFPPLDAGAAADAPPAWLSVPLRTPGGVLGALLVGGFAAFTEDQLFFAQQFADRIAAGLGREELIARLAAERREVSQVLDGLPEGIVLRDPEGEIVVNAAARELLDTAAPSSWPFEGRLLATDGTPVPFHESPLRLAALEGRIVRGAEYLLRRPQGDDATILLNASPTSGPRPPEGPGGAVAVFQDLGPRKERLQLERLLSDIGRALLDYSGPDETEPLRRIVALVAREREEWCAFSLARADGSQERITIFHPEPRLCAEEQLLALIGPRRRELGELQELLRAGETVLLGTRAEGEQEPPPAVREALREFEPLSAILAPLRTEDEYLGTFVFARIGGRPLGENEENFALGLVSRAALAIRNARLTRALERERDLLVASRDDARNTSATLEAILRHAPVGIGYVDRSLRFVLVNEVLAARSGQPPTAHAGQPVEELLGKLFPSARADIRRVLEQGRPVVRREVAPEGAAERSFHDLSCHPVRDEQDIVIGATLIDVDQTAQVEARRRIAELAALEHRRAAELTCMLDANPNAIALFGADGRLRYASSRLADLLSLSPTQAVGRHFEEVFGASRPVVNDPAGLVTDVAGHFADRTRSFTAEVEFELPERRAYRTTTAPVLGQGVYLGRIFVFVDVTMERELDRQRSEFLSIASHELKTPLTPLSLSLQGLERRLERGQQVDAAMVAKCRRHVTRLTALIDYLLDLSRLEVGRMELGREPVSLSELAEEVVDQFRNASPNHELIYAVPSRPVLIAGDRPRLEQVLVNLVQNAIKYSPLGGRVVVALEQHDEEAELSVSDDGIGIPHDDRERVFERFFRAKNATTRNFGGLGIGLFVSHEIVTRHGGSVEVESEAGRGSTFRVRLPLAAPTATGTARLSASR